ncbi:MAG: stress responsive protein [Isosphaeraceae bacterium]|jgi:hypothetical protein|nr:MAG: stress responsive protein [Isosphaeraceae bacterium]
MKLSQTRIPMAAALALSVGWMIGANSMTSTDRPLAHMVFFGLKDRSPQARAAFVQSCQKYLGDHPGTLYFSVGTIAEDVDEGAVSVKDFDVALHLVFDSKASKENYLKDPRHDAFVAENRDKFAQVRVFDSYLAD